MPTDPDVLESPRKLPGGACWAYAQYMVITPVAHLIEELALDLSRPPAPEIFETEPRFVTLDEFATRLPVGRGELTVIQGPIPPVRMLLACLAVGPWRGKRVAVDEDTYGGPGLHDFLAAVSGIPLDGSRHDAGFVWGVATHLADRSLAVVTGPEQWTELPADHDIVIIEPDHFAGGFPGLLAAAADTEAGIIVPICEAQELDVECRRITLRHAGHYPTGRHHLTVKMGEETVRLAYSGHTGRFE